MGPGRLTGMNAAEITITPYVGIGFNGARSIDRDERYDTALTLVADAMLQWGPVD